MEATDFLVAKRLHVERERAVALSKIEEYRTKADDLENKVRELEILLAHFRKWEAEEEGSDVFSIGERHAVPIRALVREFLRNTSEFVSAQLVAFVQSKSPSAKENSIRAELSLAKKRGDIRLVSKDSYASNLSAADVVNYNGMRPENEREINEPGPEFGRLTETS